MKNILPLFIVGILVLFGLQAVASSLNHVDEKHYLLTNGLGNPLPLGDELDQEQHEMHHFAFVGDSGDGYWEIAQSFVPSKEVLTRVELYVVKGITASCPYEVAIRASLTGENLAETSIPPKDIPNECGWVEFDFDDILVVPGHLYYIVSSTPDSEGNYYFWGVGIFDPYSSGTSCYSSDWGETWTKGGEGYDMCFKTYGRNKLDLDLVTKVGS